MKWSVAAGTLAGHCVQSNRFLNVCGADSGPICSKTQMESGFWFALKARDPANANDEY